MLDLNNAPLLMGIVNVTPDSFFDGGCYDVADRAIEHALQLEKEGAHILDIGGESTRPGADPISVEEESARVLPVIEGLKRSGVKALLSIDTRHAKVMEKAVAAGIDIINDVTALTHDERSLHIASESGLPVCLMHMQGDPKTMQNRPQYNSVIDDIFDYLRGRVDVCLDAGMDQKNIIIDPGIGFGKTLEDNLTILKNIDKFHKLKCPVLLGVSRKSFIGKICDGVTPEDSLPGSLAANLTGLQKQVQIFRVHDVTATKQVFDVYQAITQSA